MSTSLPVPATDRWGDRLPRRLGFWSAVAVLVGSTIGGGIFRTPAVIAERVPAPLPMFSVWVLGGLLALCGALTYAELAALFPRSGGVRSEEHTSELQSRPHLVCRLLLEKKKRKSSVSSRVRTRQLILRNKARPWWKPRRPFRASSLP